MHGTQPPLLYPPYKSTIARAPARPLIRVPPDFSDFGAPVYGYLPVGELDHDLTRHHEHEPQGQRITVSGRVVDEDGRPVPHALIEIWQTNAGGRYAHAKDDHPAPLDPNFTGSGRTLTDADGAYPWRNHPNAWRPAHIHFSLFGTAFISRLVTQMYFPGDPLLPLDPVLGGVPEEGRPLLVARYDHDVTEPGIALGYHFDIVLRGRSQTPMETR